jgi:hypothetical protein
MEWVPSIGLKTRLLIDAFPEPRFLSSYAAEPLNGVPLLSLLIIGRCENRESRGPGGLRNVCGDKEPHPPPGRGRTGWTWPHYDGDDDDYLPPSRPSRPLHEARQQPICICRISHVKEAFLLLVRLRVSVFEGTAFTGNGG